MSVYVVAQLSVLRFGSGGDLDAWASSDAYRAIAADRRAATTGSILVVRGLEPR